MSKEQIIQQAADALALARATRQPIAPLAGRFDLSGIEDAYAVANVNTRARIASGRRIVGTKIGLTSKAVQQQLGVDQPDFGMLFDDMEFAHGSDVPTSALIQPKIEAEVAFVVTRDCPDHPPSYAELLACVGYALPALEIVDSAITDWKISLLDTVADNASSALFVLGDQPVATASLSLGGLGMQMTVNGRTVSTGSGAACLGHPLRAAHWLARTMAQRGSPLRQGQVVLSGALGPMVPVKASDWVHASIGALGEVTCRMADAAVP